MWITNDFFFVTGQVRGSVPNSTCYHPYV